MPLQLTERGCWEPKKTRESLKKLDNSTQASQGKALGGSAPSAAQKWYVFSLALFFLAFLFFSFFSSFFYFCVAFGSIFGFFVIFF